MNTTIRTHITWHALAALRAAAVLAACNSGGDSGSDGPTASATVGAAGGSLSSPDGSLVLTIPAGALGNDTAITITEVAAGAVPEHLKALGGDRVYRLGPAGTQFAQPVAASVTLAAGNQLAVMLIDSDGATAYAGNQQVRIDAQGRRVLGEVTHFSYLVARTVGSFTGELTLDKRMLKVGHELTAEVRLSKTTSDEDGSSRCHGYPGEGLSTVLVPTTGLVRVSCQVDFYRGKAASVMESTSWRCANPGTEVVRIVFEILGLGNLLPAVLTKPDVKLIVETDVVCTAGEPPDEIATGVFPLTIGTNPDGVQVISDPYNGKPGPWLSIAVREGVVLVNLVTGLTEVNLTSTGEGALGGDNFDAAWITDGIGNWAAFAMGQTGGALRPRDASGAWLFTHATLQLATDAATFGGNPQANAQVVTQQSGVDFVAKDPATGVFGFVAERLDFSLFPPPSRPISATPTSTTANPSVIALIPGTDNGTTSTVAFHAWGSPTLPADVLFTIPDPNGRRVRCHPLPDGRLVCIVSAASLGKAWKFIFDPAQPKAPVATEELKVGVGSVGVEMELAADGTILAAVANPADKTYNVLRIAEDATVTSNRSFTPPTGIDSTAHVWPFSHGGKNYVAGASMNNNAIFVLLHM